MRRSVRPRSHRVVYVGDGFGDICAARSLQAEDIVCARDGFRPWRWVGRFINKPGWSPDGAHARSPELKAAYLAAHPEQAGTPGLSAKHLKHAHSSAPVAAE